MDRGTWDSIHVIQVGDEGDSATYKLTSTVMLQMNVSKQETGNVDLSGSLTRQVPFLSISPSSAESSHPQPLAEYICSHIPSSERKFILIDFHIYALSPCFCAHMHTIVYP